MATATKTASAHTKGPWGARRSERMFKGIPFVAAEGGRGIVLANITDRGRGNYEGRLGSPLADARVMAAGPDLLEACEFTLELLDDLSTGQFAIGGDRPAREKLAAAIGRARGTTD